MAADPQHVDVVASEPDDPQTLWAPAVGEETTALLDRSLDDDGTRDQVARQAVDILARCGAPGGTGTKGTRTGLVVGYVQSGKTLSFTTLVSLARDNGFPLVVLLAGTKQNLHKQTADRLENDLEVERSGGLSPWAVLHNPGPTAGNIDLVASYVRGAMNPTTPPKFRRTTVITVMKNRSRLGKLRELLAALTTQGIDVAMTPLLVIDDEADQAGLNAAVQRDDETATYTAIVELRGTLERHSYVMYTATPQAPLLVSLADLLSPDFVAVLQPGPGYTGGQYFFEQHKTSFLKVLGDRTMREALDPGLVDPPIELQKALATYLLVVAVRGTGPVSMLVHPSHTQDLHGKYEGFVRALLKSWRALLASDDPDRDELLDDLFRPAHRDLEAHSDRALPSLDHLLVELPHWIDHTQVRVVNSGTPADADITWAHAPSWILVGGNKLDRGFTVEGLAVTFMPRSAGVGHADSIQQRARFFGYKKSYGSLCRAWLSPTTADAFEQYVQHEQVLRKELATAASEGVRLQTWTRQMLLDPRFKPCRRAVVALPYLHGRVRGETWESVARLAGIGKSREQNLARAEEFVAAGRPGSTPDPRDQRRNTARHWLFSVALSDLLNGLLADWQGHLADRALLAQAALLLRAKLDDLPDLVADVFVMDDFRQRERQLRSGTTAVNNLQQGRSPNGTYPGDKVFFTSGRTSVQLHRILIKDTGEEGVGLSLRVPAELAGGALVQESKLE